MLLRPSAIVVACAALAAGCGTADGERDTPAATAAPQASSSASVARLADARRAVRTAERKLRHGRAYDIESDRLRGQRVWEVKVARGTTHASVLDVRADGRRVVRQRRTKVSDDVRKAAGAKVSLNRALKTAGARAAGGRFDEAEIDRWRGKLVWEATFKRSGDREVEVKIDARSGKVLDVSQDD
ncbi:MAG TPA: PepSY domain-containing protein [Solirubrobacter sp.]|nr:PepSY domain-containing protein [Solirubrobacter sp.]